MLVKIADAGLLVSAAHVLDLATIHKIPYLIGGFSGGADMIRLEGVEVHATGMPPSQSRRDDPFDVAVIRLQPEVVEQLEQHKRFLRLFQIDPTVGPDPGNYYFVYGFPHALSSTDHDRRIARVTSFRYGTNAFHQAAAVIPGFDRHKDFVVSMPPTGNIDSDGNEVSLPRLEAISGCGMWRLSGQRVDMDTWTADEIRLVAIEHRISQGRYIRGTRIAIVNRLIWESFPDLRTSMRVGFGE